MKKFLATAMAGLMLCSSASAAKSADTIILDQLVQFSAIPGTAIVHEDTLYANPTEQISAAAEWFIEDTIESIYGYYAFDPLKSGNGVAFMLFFPTDFTETENVNFIIIDYDGDFETPQVYDYDAEENGIFLYFNFDYKVDIPLYLIIINGPVG